MIEFKTRRVSNVFTEVLVKHESATLDLGFLNEAERVALAAELRSAADDLHPEAAE